MKKGEGSHPQNRSIFTTKIKGFSVAPFCRFLYFHSPDQSFSLATPPWEVAREKGGCGCNIVCDLVHVDLHLPNWHFCILAFTWTWDGLDRPTQQKILSSVLWFWISLTNKDNLAPFLNHLAFMGRLGEAAIRTGFFKAVWTAGPLLPVENSNVRDNPQWGEHSSPPSDVPYRSVSQHHGDCVPRAPAESFRIQDKERKNMLSL